MFLEPSGSVRAPFTEVWDVNVAGTHLVTEASIPLLLAATQPRLVFITSGVSTLQELAAGTRPLYTTDLPRGWPKQPGLVPYMPYAASKAGLNYVALEWARVLRGDGVRVFLVSPGMLATGLGAREGTDRAHQARVLAGHGAIDPAVGVSFVADVVAGRRDEEAWPSRVMRAEADQPF